MNHIGIDLGTTNSVACTMKDGRFAFLDFRRTDLLPSVMMYQNGKVTVGEPAKRKREIFPNNYISSAKTHMGEQTADGKLKPVAVIEGRSFTATDVATEVLSEIYRVARKFFGNEEPIEAVITTPAYFDSVQNRETQKAGEAAGFQIKQILAEPVAAVLHMRWMTAIQVKRFSLWISAAERLMLLCLRPKATASSMLSGKQATTIWAEMILTMRYSKSCTAISA